MVMDGGHRQHLLDLSRPDATAGAVALALDDDQVAPLVATGEVRRQVTSSTDLPHTAVAEPTHRVGHRLLEPGRAEGQEAVYSSYSKAPVAG